MFVTRSSRKEAYHGGFGDDTKEITLGNGRSSQNDAKIRREICECCGNFARSRSDLRSIVLP